MLLAEINNKLLANKTFSYSGMDSLSRCLDATHFQTYPHEISYQFNSRGFRDREWPEDLTNSIWCLGDSFTLGLGSPLAHIWPRVLESCVSRNTINISMDGASNDWIARQAVAVLQQVKPTHMAIMWSYLHRREHAQGVNGHERRRHYDYTSHQQDLENFMANVRKVTGCAGTTRLIMCTVPRAFVDPLTSVFDLWRRIADPQWPSAPITDQDMDDLPAYIREEMQNQLACWDHYNDLRNLHSRFLQSVPAGSSVLEFPDLIFEVEQLDRARDGHHFDIDTSRALAVRLQQALYLS